MKRLAMPRGVVIDRDAPANYGIATATNPNIEPLPRFAAYFPSYWEPMAKRPLVIALHGTTDTTNNAGYYRRMIENEPEAVGDYGALGAIGNGPDFGKLANGDPVPVPAGFAALGPKWTDLAETHNFAVVCPRVFFSGSAASLPFLGFGSSWAFDFVAECHCLAIAAYLKSISMLHPSAEVMGTGHSSGATLCAIIGTRWPGFFSRMVMTHGNYGATTQAEWNFNVDSFNRFQGRTWDWTEEDGFSNIQLPCDGNATTSFNPASGACDLVKANYRYQANPGLATMIATPILSLSGNNSTDGDGGSNTYADLTDTALSVFLTGLGYVNVFTVEYEANSENAFTGGDPATRGPTVAVTGQRFYPHGFHDFAKVAACTFFFDPSPNSTRYA